MKAEVRQARREDLPALLSLLSELGEISPEALEAAWSRVALCPCTRVYVVEWGGGERWWPPTPSTSSPTWAMGGGPSP
ncbi:hypothetical protein TthSNM76_20070 (plasmid) [Thermus thermophilus]|nr:hypothetical protein TthSNM76_20070 [Thermus thermophilus]